MILEHYSAAPLTRVLSACQPDRPMPKPNGLWVSVPGEDDWPSWCRGEGFHLDQLQTCTRFTLRPGAPVLLLESTLAIDEFHMRYRRAAFPGAGSGWDADWIDWGRVAADHAGIIIAPYQWGRRLDAPASHWYYGWDCASGCIWSPDALVRAS